MIRYVIKRLLITIPILVFVAFCIFTLLYFTPGDPARLILGSEATDADVAEYHAALGLDRPYIVQLGEYLNKLFLKHDLGKSWIYSTNISDEIVARMPRTLAISIYSVLVGALCGIPMGVMAAVHQDKLADKIVLALSSIAHCIPNFVVALVLILIFAVKLNWLPAYGFGSFKHYILPCLCIFLGGFASMARSMRSQMLEVIRSDFVMAAKAQGFSAKSVYYRHALPNALIPIITQIGSQFAMALGGTIILETVFSIPGMGLYLQGAISKQDIPVVLACTTFLAACFCIIMLVVDVVYALIDPRIKAQYEAQQKYHKRRKAVRTRS